MEFKGTSGKWKTRIDYDNKYKQLAIAINSRGVDNVATIWSGGELTECTHADATLISKAPEMFEMLKSVLELQQEKYGNGSGLHLAMIAKAKEIEKLLQEATTLPNG